MATTKRKLTKSGIAMVRNARVKGFETDWTRVFCPDCKAEARGALPIHREGCPRIADPIMRGMAVDAFQSFQKAVGEMERHGAASSALIWVLGEAIGWCAIRFGAAMAKRYGNPIAPREVRAVMQQAINSAVEAADIIGG